MSRVLRIFLALGLCISGIALQAADKITVSAAASLKNALTEVAESFKHSHPGKQIDISYSSSGKAVAQIQQGLPVDVFCAADMEFPEKLVQAGLANGPVRPFAMGRLVLWSASIPANQLNLKVLADPKVQRIAVANPKLAPYGARTIETLKATGLLGQVESKIVYGENISQAAQYALSGATQVGFVALSLAVAPEMATKGHYFVVPDNLHQPLAQGYVILKRSEHNPLARQFADYLLTKPAQAIFKKHGFSTPRK